MSALTEEQKARRQHRNLERARKAAQSKRAQERAAQIREVLGRPSARACRCGIRPSMTLAELISLGAGCTDPGYVCPTLDAVRRKLGA